VYSITIFKHISMHTHQALLAYDVLPLQFQAFGNIAKSSLLIPPLLALTYMLLGGVFPPLVERVSARLSEHDNTPFHAPF